MGGKNENEEFAPMGANSFLQELTPSEMGGKNENYRVVSPKSVLIHVIYTFLKGII